MKRYLYSFSFALLLMAGIISSTGCAEDPSSIPSFVKIDTIIVDSTNYSEFGSVRHKANFAFVYIDDNFQGAYQLPAKFPVIGEGKKKISVYAGVYEFGNTSVITRYIFYKPYIINDTLVVQDTLLLNPHVQYDSAGTYAKIQDFDSFTGSFGSDFYQSSPNGNYNYAFPDTDPETEGLCGYMYMSADSTGTSCVIESTTPIVLPKTGAGYFLELDYKCNSPFYFDLKTSTGYRSIIGFNPKPNWNKAYINITYAVQVTPGNDFRLVFKMNRDETIATQEVYLDNIKLIYLD